jgi:2-polyprenyl-3-methyl-5-hydroxy-6-metoxy-1,4-benzoquinol methylase
MAIPAKVESVQTRAKEALASRVSVVAKRLPSSVKGLMPAGVKARILDRLELRSVEPTKTFGELQSLMHERYHVGNLVSVDRQDFKDTIDAFLALEDASMEGYDSGAGQRIKTVRFIWPYDHDFGDFKVGPGKQRYRPVQLISSFMDEFGVPSTDLTGKTVLDIGCYLGGTSLLLAAMGAEVVAVEEVKKYVDCLSYLRDAFGVENLHPRNLSLYALTDDEFQDAFDIVLFSGVLYHLSDPVLGMRLTFNAVRPGGVVLLETAAARSEDRILEYAGKNQAKRKFGANWFVPSPLVVTEMMDEVGYTDIRTAIQRNRHRPHSRVLAVGKKQKQVDMLRAGLSVPTIR